MRLGDFQNKSTGARSSAEASTLVVGANFRRGFDEAQFLETSAAKINRNQYVTGTHKKRSVKCAESNTLRVVSPDPIKPSRHGRTRPTYRGATWSPTDTADVRAHAHRKTYENTS